MSGCVTFRVLSGCSPIHPNAHFKKRRKSMLKPVAVIRKVEDSPDYIDRRLVEAYLHTSYSVLAASFPPICVRVLQPTLESWLDDHGHKTFAFITAWNPFSRLSPLSENQSNNKYLEADLLQAARRILPGLGTGTDDQWRPEESFLALDIDADSAIRLGRKYHQNAIVWWEKGELPALWWL